MEGGYHGHEGIRRWWNNLLDAIPDYAMNADIRVSGRCVTFCVTPVLPAGADGVAEHFCTSFTTGSLHVAAQSVWLGSESAHPQGGLA
jgi:hypothetical protein